MEIVVHSKKSLFQQKFKKNVPFQQEIPNLRVWCKKWSNWTSRVGQKIWLRLPALLAIRLRPKTSDCIWLQLRLRNPDHHDSLIGCGLLIFCRLVFSSVFFILGFWTPFGVSQVVCGADLHLLAIFPVFSMTWPGNWELNPAYHPCCVLSKLHNLLSCSLNFTSFYISI